MPTLTETLTETNAKLEALLGGTDGTEKAAEKLPADQVLSHIAAEVKAGNVSKARSEYHQQVLAELAKNNFEATSFMPIKVLNDPMQIKPQTATIGTIQTLVAGTPQNHFSTNLSAAMKAELMKRLVLQPEIIAKGAYKDKLDDLQSFFGLSDKDMEDSYDISWKVSDLVRALQNAVKLESFVSKSTEKQEESVKSLLGDGVWPNDMAQAEFDPVEKKYKRGPTPFDAK